jgi:hypothetical protein
LFAANILLELQELDDNTVGQSHFHKEMCFHLEFANASCVVDEMYVLKLSFLDSFDTALLGSMVK